MKRVHYTFIASTLYVSQEYTSHLMLGMPCKMPRDLYSDRILVINILLFN